MRFPIDEFFIWLFLAAIALMPVMFALGKVWDWLNTRKVAGMKIVCRLCGMRYYAESGKRIVKCPHCGALNSRK